MRTTLLLSLLALSSTASAAELVIGTPALGDTLDGAPVQTISVSGRITGVTQATFDRVEFRDQVALINQAWVSKGTVDFEVWVEVVATDSPFVPIVGEVFEIGNPEPVARARTTMYDLRPYPGAALAPNTQPGWALGRVTPRGFRALATVHDDARAAAGWPSLSERANDAIGAGAELDLVDTSRVRIPLLEYLTTLAPDEGDSLVADIVETVSDAVSALGHVGIDVQGMVFDVVEIYVRDPQPTVLAIDAAPVTAEYEVLDGALEGTLTSADPGAEVEVALIWGLRVDMDALIGIPTPALFVPMPGKLRCDGTWTTTDDVTATGTVTIAVDAADPERLDVQPAGNTLAFLGAPGTLVGDGVCELPDVAAIVDGAEPGVRSAVAMLLGGAMFEQIEGENELSAVLQEDLASFEIGLEPWDHGDLTAEFAPPEMLGSTGIRYDPWGLTLELTASTAPNDTLVGLEQDHTYTVPPQRSRPGVDTPDSDPYDTAAFVTTGGVNSHLRVQASTELLTFDKHEWTRADLGLACSSSTCDDVVPLTGTNLSKIVPELAAYGADEAYVRYRPVFAPVVTMEVDAQGTEADAFFWLAHYEIDLVSKTSGDVWLHTVVDASADDVSLTLDGVDGKYGLARGPLSVGGLAIAWGGLSSKPSDADVDRLYGRLVPPLLDSLDQLVPEISSPELQNVALPVQKQTHNMGQRFELYLDL